MTCLVEEMARLWCRRGLGYAGADLRKMDVSGVHLGGRSHDEAGSAHIYLTGVGRDVSAAAGASGARLLESCRLGMAASASSLDEGGMAVRK